MTKYFTFLLIVNMFLKCANGKKNGTDIITTASDQCHTLTNCVECVYDSSVGILETVQKCAWCGITQTCNRLTSSETVKCLDVVSSYKGHVNRCSDLKCSAAYITNNIHFCRWTNISVVVFAIILFLISVFFYLWLLAIQQLPWKYLNIHDLVKERSARHPLLSFWGDGIHLEGEEAVVRSSALEDANGTKCPCCHIIQIEPLAHAELCFWCEIARVAFVPLFLGFSCSILTLVFAFGLSLKPWFADWYYTMLLAVPYVAYALFFIYLFMFRVTILGDPSQRQSCFFMLAFILVGRKIASVLPVDPMEKEASCEREMTIFTTSDERRESQPKTDIPNQNDDTNLQPLCIYSSSSDSVYNQSRELNSGAGEIETPISLDTTINNPKTIDDNNEEATDIKKLKMAETIRLINSECKINVAVRKKLKKELQHDEVVEWWDKPDSKKIAVDDRWLIHSFITGTTFGIWLFMCSYVPSNEYAITRLMDPSTMVFVGGCITLLFLLALLMTINGCRRTYILTNKRIIIIANGLAGVNFFSCPLSSIEYAAIFAYDEYIAGGVILSFSWEQPSGNRHMPPISTNRLPAITDMDEFLVKFRAVSPEITKAAALKQNLSHLRKVWRLHVFINMVFLELIPIITVYSNITPLPLTLLGTCIFASLPICLIQRGMRYQQLIYLTLNLKRGWSINEDDTQRFFRRLREASRKRLPLFSMGLSFQGSPFKRNLSASGSSILFEKK